MKSICPNDRCPFYGTKEFVKKDGHFYRRCESRLIQRYKCTHCQRKFSNATGTLEFRQKKRRINSKLRGLLCSGISLRRAARELKINSKTVERKFFYLAKKASISHTKFLADQKRKVSHLQFDDLITLEHTKLKPLTVSLAVDAGRRFILGAKVAPIGAFGHLAQMSRRKYGVRPNQHRDALEQLFKEISPTISRGALVCSDEHQTYPHVVARYLPHCDY